MKRYAIATIIAAAVLSLAFAVPAGKPHRKPCRIMCPNIATASATSAPALKHADRATATPTIDYNPIIATWTAAHCGAGMWAGEILTCISTALPTPTPISPGQGYP